MIGIRTNDSRIAFGGMAVLAGILALGCSEARSQSGAVSTETVPVHLADIQDGADRLDVLLTNALSNDVNAHDVAIMELRRFGQDAVNYIMGRQELRHSPRWNEVLDKVAQQKDARFSGLYWYTDLDQALAKAYREKKPVLSLRLLGNLTEELSCANSRFFRTTLYPNPDIRKLLANDFVLHWQWVRPAPIITIDFRDGRKIERTITGNSLHMVLDPHGRPVDVLPGLYAPMMFIQVLGESGPAAVQMTGLNDDQFRAARTEFHSHRLAVLRQSWQDLCEQAQLPTEPAIGVDLPENDWTLLAAKAIPEPVIFGKETSQAIAMHAPPAEQAGALAKGKGGSELPILRVMRNVSDMIREDSIRNEYHLHVRIHKWFATPTSNPSGAEAGQSVMSGHVPGQGTLPVRNRSASMTSRGQGNRSDLEREPLINRIYSELFLSPLNDPWYGLSKPDVYSAVKNDGRTHAVTQNTRH